MLRKLFSYGGLLLLAGAVTFATPDSGQAARGGGFHGGGFHGGGFHGGGFHGGYRGGFGYGGYRGGFYRGGYHYRPYYGYGGYYPYSYGGYYPYSYGYYPYYSGYYPYDTGYSPYYGASSDDTPWYTESSDAYSPGVTTAGFTSVSPLSGGGEVAAPGQADTTARLTVTVPAGADIWIEGSKTSSAGPVREFQSPPLTPGGRYAYTLKASWKDNGREVTQTQKVGVSAGAHVNVQFPVPAGTAGQISATSTR